MYGPYNIGHKGENMKKILLTSMILTLSIFAFDNTTTLISKTVKNRWQRFLPGKPESSTINIKAARDMEGNQYTLKQDAEGYFYANVALDDNTLARYYLYEKDGLYTLESDKKNIDERDRVIAVSLSE